MIAIQTIQRKLRIIHTFIRNLEQLERHQIFTTVNIQIADLTAATRTCLPLPTAVKAFPHEFFIAWMEYGFIY